MSRQHIQLALTTQEHAALSIALSALLKLWGDSEDASQERIRAKLRSIAKKLEVPGAERNNNAGQPSSSALKSTTVRISGQ
jgi:hypothetical protein